MPTVGERDGRWKSLKQDIELMAGVATPLTIPLCSLCIHVQLPRVHR